MIMHGRPAAHDAVHTQCWPGRYRCKRSWLRWLLLPWLLGGVVCSAATDISAMQALQAAEARKDGLATLRQRAQQTTNEARSLQAAVEATRKVWQSDQAAGVQVVATIEGAADCLSKLHTELRERARSRDQLEQGYAQSLQAVRIVANATAEQLSRAALDSDAAFTTRTMAEQAYAEQRRALVNQTTECLRLVSSADLQIDQAFEHHAQLGQHASILATLLQGVRAQLDQAMSAHRAATEAQWLDASPPKLVLPPGDRIGLLEQSLLNKPVRGARTALSALQAFANSDTDEHRLRVVLARLQDSVTYIDLVLGPDSRNCMGEACLSLAAERRELAQRTLDVRAAMEAAHARAANVEASLGTLLLPLQTALQAHGRSMEAVAVTLPGALDDATTASHAGGAAAGSLLHSADALLTQALRDWDAAYRLAHGTPPDQTTTASADPETPIDRVKPPVAPKIIPKTLPPPQLRSHAYELFGDWDTELQGFGAYTYVLLRSANDLKTPAVRRRFLQLLTTLQKLPEARLVSADDSRHVNLFCIPGTTATGTNGDAIPVVYASDLGQQLKLRAQNGLLTRKEVSRRMIDSPGPFLITLPSRIAHVTSSAPLLFADLSAYPDDAIADLASHYMNGLVNDFPSQQLLWKPPVLQRVALVMIHLASGASDIVTRMMPTATAAPR